MPEKTTGFTLIEIVLVLAISGLLFIIAFAGQRQLRDRATFDGGVNKIVQDINYARTYGTSNVNEVGNGTDTQDLVVGASIEFDSPGGHYTDEIEPVYTSTDASGGPDWSTLSKWPPHATLADCPNSQHPDEPGLGYACKETFFYSSDPTLSSVDKVVVYFLNKGQGLFVCSNINDQYPDPSSACSNTPPGPISIGLIDGAGYKATIQVDPSSGLAHRIN
ncbi:MAG TPA: prepilin-type N-terminal cleavage/methylation domain-containing protein [Candidatus Saccharimonadia bacterium]|jgi:prepilin-type N-terminal cleavage/methylation domain-containing protein